MAGGKMTPRQKMINLMYLVLTAMLALNVSSAILEKFEKINRSLEYSKNQAVGNDAAIIERMGKTMKESTSLPPNAQQLMQKAHDVKSKTDEVLAKLEGFKQEIIQKAGNGYEEDKIHIKNKEAQTVVEQMMIGSGSNKNGKGYELKKVLDDFTDYINTVTKDVSVENLALDGKNDPDTKNNPNQNKKDFVALSFEQTPVVAALALISQKENDVVRYQTEVLNSLADKLNLVEIKPDKVEVAVEQESRYVAAGTKYKAEMFLAAGFSKAPATMTFNGSNASVVNGRGKVEFAAQSGAYDKDGLAKKSWEAVIRFKTSSGRDTLFKKTIEYFVVKPTIEVRSGSVQALYLNCGNDLNVQVPALGNDYQPAFTAPGCQVIPGPQRGIITVVPTSLNEVNLTVSSKGSLIGSVKFPVRPIPRPSVEIVSGGTPVNQKIGVDAPGPSQLQARAIADEGFKTALPNDAKYRVQDWEVTLVRGRRPAVGPLRFNGDQANIGAIRQQARPGDRVVIEVKSVKRMNYKGQLEEARISGGGVFSIPIN